MLDHADYVKLAQLMDSDEETRTLIEKLMEDHRFTVSGITHEIRNTLTIINSSMQLIGETHPETAFFAYWNETIEDLQYLRDLLDDLSDFNKSTLLNKTHFSLPDMLRPLEDTFRRLADSQGKNLRFYCGQNLPLLFADRVKLRQVITNLLKNALEAAEESGSVNLKADLGDGCLYIKVSDDGCGIRPENLDTIFEPFVTFKKNGTGLGLPIARQIAEAHGGTLSAESAPGLGSTFTLSLPTDQADNSLFCEEAAASLLLCTK